MIRKKDLVKEFELVVKQEILEHNKAITASNLAVNKLSAKLDALNQSNEDKFKKLITRLDSFDNQLVVNHECFSNTYAEFEKLKNDQFVLNERNHNEIQEVTQYVDSKNNKRTRFENRLYSLEVLKEKFSEGLNGIIKNSELLEDRITFRVAKALKNLKEEILSLPSEIGSVKEEFMEELAMHKIDNKGLLKEIQVLKKTVFINEKKIEHLNTMIERISTIKT